jgi:PAS domain S-box-containing protein
VGWQYTPYALGSLMTAAVAAGLSVYALRRRGIPGARMAALFMAGVSVWGAAYAVELGTTDLAANILWSKIGYVGIVLVPFSWLGFTVEYTGRGAWLGRHTLALLAVVPVLTLVLVFTNEGHHLFWSATSLDTSGPFVILSLNHGPAFWVWLAYAYALLLAGGALVVSMLLRSGSLYSKQGWALLFGMAAPWLGNALYLSGLNPVPGLDLTPFCFLLTGVATAVAISRFRLLDVVPVARAAVVDGMKDGVIVLDPQNRILDMNPAARCISKLPPSEAIGLPADQVISSEEVLREIQGGSDEVRTQVRIGDGVARRDYEMTLSSLRGRGARAIRFIVVRDVTERVERELLFRLIVENASDVVEIYERDASFRYVSPSIERVLGYEPEEALKLGNVREIIHPDDVDWVLARFEEIWTTPGVNAPVSFRMRHADGSWRYMEGIYNNLLHDPEVGGVVATWRDVTGRVEAEEEARKLNAELEARVTERTAELSMTLSELKESERALTENEERYRSLVENIPVVVYMDRIDAESSTMYISPRVEQVLGYLPDEFTSDAGFWPDVLHPDDREMVLAENDRTNRTGEPFRMQYRMIRKDGSVVWIEDEAVLIRDEEGRPMYWQGVFADITGRRKVEEKLEESEAKYRAIFENAVEGIFQTTPEGRLITANPAMARIFGYESPEALASSATDVAAELYANPARREELAAGMRREGSISGFEAKVLRRDGSVAWTSVNARAVRDEAGELIAYEGTLEDVTERVEARRTLERRVAGLTRIAASLTVDQPLKATLDSLAAGVVGTTAALACSVYLIDPKSGTLLLTGVYGLPDGYADAVRASWREGRPSPAQSAFESHDPLLVQSGQRLLLEDPGYTPIHASIREASWDTIYITPLVAWGESLGTINVYYPPDWKPAEDEETFLEAVANQAAVAVQNARLFSAAQGAAALQERQRLSRELHDSVSQALYGIALGSRTARTLLDRDPSSAVEPLDYVLSLAEAGLAEMRALIFELRPEALETDGLIAALEKQAAALHVRHEIRVNTALCDVEPRMSPETKEALYRIAQEAMQNTVKHAGASNVDLKLEQENGTVALEVSDDGSGFDPSGSFPGHLGLRSMRERATQIGGTLEILSKPGEGTRVLTRIPL